MLLIDTRSTHVQAREIADDLRTLTAAPVTIVVDTHGHFDHAFGNHVFRPATVWGHERCVAFIERTGEVRRARVAAEMPEMACRPGRGRPRSARPNIRRDGLRRRRRPASGAQTHRSRAYRSRHRDQGPGRRGHVRRGPASRTAPFLRSGTAIRSTGRRPRRASRSSSLASSSRAWRQRRTGFRGGAGRCARGPRRAAPDASIAVSSRSTMPSPRPVPAYPADDVRRPLERGLAQLRGHFA